MDTKTWKYASLVAALITTIITAGSLGSPVYAQTACVAQLYTPTVYHAQYGYSPVNVGLTVQITVTCGFNINQINVVVTVYDVSQHTNVNAASVVLTGSNGVFSGQLVFGIPSFYQGKMQISALVYNGYGQLPTLLASTTETTLFNLPQTIYPNYCPPTEYNCYGHGYYNGGYNGQIHAGLCAQVCDRVVS